MEYSMRKSFLAVAIALFCAAAAVCASPVPPAEELQAQPRSSSLFPPYDINPYFGFRKYGEMRYEPLNFEYIRSSGGRVLENLLESVGGLGGAAAGMNPYSSGGAKSSIDSTGRVGKALRPAQTGVRIPAAALREVYRMNGLL